MTDPLPEKPKRAYTPKVPTRLIAEALQHTSGLPVLAAQRLNCHPSVIYARLKKVPALREIQEYAREELVDLAEMGLKTSVMERESWALQFVLRTLGRSRGYVEPSKYTLEVSGLGGKPIEHAHTMQHMIQEMANDPQYLEAARLAAIQSESNTIDATFARPVGALPAPETPLDQAAEAEGTDAPIRIIEPLEEDRDPRLSGGNG